MASRVVVTALDDGLHVGVVLLSFGAKKPIATHAGCWLYVMEGSPSVPDKAVYGATNRSGDEWAVSRGLRPLLDWIDSQNG